MGDPKKLRKKYSTPNHPWNLKNIEVGRVLTKEYGLGKKKEILIANSFMKKYKDIAKNLIANTTKQGEKEKIQVFNKLQRLGLLSAGAELDQVLGLSVNDVLNRRLQSVVFRKGLARSMKQARQFITHRHITVGSKEITSPSYIVSLEEEAHITFKGKSALADEEHPERVNEAAEIKKEAEAIKPIKDEKSDSTEEEVAEVVPKENKSAEAVKESKEEKSSLNETVEKTVIDEKETKEEILDPSAEKEAESKKEEKISEKSKEVIGTTEEKKE
jgi:small subunit ribosomal protein S4